MAANDKRTVNLGNLPSEILQGIFRYLDHFDLKQIRLASSRFYQLSRDEFLSKTIIKVDNMKIEDFSNEIWRSREINILGSNLEKIIQFTKLHGHLVKTLVVYIDSSSSSMRCLCNILKTVPNLSTLKVRSSSLLDNNVTHQH